MFTLLLGVAPRAEAKNEHVVVAALGAGYHTFNKRDGVRKDPFYNDITGGLTSYVSADWFFADRFGLGLRDTTVLSGGLRDIGGVRTVDTINLNTFMVTANYFPVIFGDGYFRVGLLGGYGSATYRHDIDALTSSSYETSGTASMMGGYFDWGGDGFGAKLGYTTMNTDLDKLNQGGTKLSVDGSGAHWFFSFRWAITEAMWRAGQ